MIERNKIKDLKPLVDAAKADADGPKRFAPYLRLYMAGNPLSEAAKAKQLEAPEGRGGADRGLIRPRYARAGRRMGFALAGRPDGAASGARPPWSPCMVELFDALRHLDPHRGHPRRGTVHRVRIRGGQWLSRHRQRRDDRDLHPDVRPMPAVVFSGLCNFLGVFLGGRPSPSRSSTCCPSTC